MFDVEDFQNFRYLGLDPGYFALCLNGSGSCDMSDVLDLDVCMHNIRIVLLNGKKTEPPPRVVYSFLVHILSKLQVALYRSIMKDIIARSRMDECKYT